MMAPTPRIPLKAAAAAISLLMLATGSTLALAAEKAADGTVSPVAQDCIVQDKLMDDSLNVKLFLHRQQFSLPPATGAVQ
jgi:hypothetical protein